jgi:hypothetical protein
MTVRTWLTVRWSRFVAAHLIADDPMDDERLRHRARRASWADLLNGRPPR